MAVEPVPTHLGTVTPHLACTPCAEAIDFYGRALGAGEIQPCMTGLDSSVEPS